MESRPLSDASVLCRHGPTEGRVSTPRDWRPDLRDIGGGGDLDFRQTFSASVTAASNFRRSLLAF